MGGILDDRKAVTGGDGFDRVVVRGEAEEVDGDDGAGAEGPPCRFSAVLGPAVNHGPVGKGRLDGRLAWADGPDGAGQRAPGTIFLHADDRLFQSFRVNIEGERVDVHEGRRRADQADHLGRCGESKRRCEDGVPRTDIEGHKRHEKGVRARGAADGVLYTDVAGEKRFQLPDLRPVDVLAVGEDRSDSGIQFIRDAPLLGGKIDKIH